MTRRGWIWIASGLVVHLLFLASLRTGTLDPFFNDSTHRLGKACDFFVIYQAGMNLKRGETPYIVLPKDVPYCWRDYRYLPLSALALSLPLSFFSPWTAWGVWVGVNEILLLACLVALGALCRWLDPFPMLAFLWLAFTPLYLELYMGQFDFAVASGVFLAVAFWRSGRELPGAVAWTAGTAVKYNGLILLPALLKTRRFRTILAFLSITLAVALPFFLLRPQDLEHFLKTARRTAFAVPHAGNLGFQAFVSSWLTPFSPRIFTDLDRFFDHRVVLAALSFFQGALALGLAAAAVGATIRARRGDLVARIGALWIMVYMLGYGEVWEHHHVWMLPAFTLLTLEGWKRLAPAVGFLLALPTPFFLLDRPREEVIAATHPAFDSPDPFVLWSPVEMLAYHAVKALPVAVLFAVVLRDLWRDREASTTA